MKRTKSQKLPSHTINHYRPNVVQNNNTWAIILYYTILYYSILLGYRKGYQTRQSASPFMLISSRFSLARFDDTPLNPPASQTLISDIVFFQTVLFIYLFLLPIQPRLKCRKKKRGECSRGVGPELLRGFGCMDAGEKMQADSILESCKYKLCVCQRQEEVKWQQSGNSFGRKGIKKT